MIVTKNIISNAIGYEKVTEEVHKDYHRFDILPDDETLPKAYIAFGIEDAGYYILQAGFGDWHDHFELYDDEEKNIKEAFKFFKNLVAGECFMIKKVNEKGKYLGGAIIDSKIDSSLHAPISLSSKGKNNRLLKVEFNKPYEDYKINDT